MNGNREHVRSITVQVATEEEEQQQEEEEARVHDEAAAMEADEAAEAGHGHDLQEAAADAIAWMNEAVARRNPNAEVAAAGFSWRNGVVAWKRIGLAWRIDAPLVADVAPEDGDGDGAVGVAATAWPWSWASEFSSSSWRLCSASSCDGNGIHACIQLALPVASTVVTATS